jgi:hypothetical protein
MNNTRQLMALLPRDGRSFKFPGPLLALFEVMCLIARASVTALLPHLSLTPYDRTQLQNDKQRIC